MQKDWLQIGKRNQQRPGKSIPYRQKMFVVGRSGKHVCPGYLWLCQLENTDVGAIRSKSSWLSPDCCWNLNIFQIYFPQIGLETQVLLNICIPASPVYQLSELGELKYYTFKLRQFYRPQGQGSFILAWQKYFFLVMQTPRSRFAYTTSFSQRQSRDSRQTLMVVVVHHQEPLTPSDIRPQH